MTGAPPAHEPAHAALTARIRALEARLQESEETLDAIRRGEIDAFVMANASKGHEVYTIGAADRPYRVLIEEIQEGALTLDETGTILYCNRRLADMLAADQQALIGRNLATLVPLAADAALFPALLGEALRQGARRELTIAVRPEQPVPVALSLSPLPSDGGFNLLCGVVTDLTQHKQHIEALAEANRRLRAEIQERERVEEALRQSQKMEAVGQLTVGLAHDFNNLLTGITAGLEMLQTRLRQGRLQGVDRYVGIAQDAARRAAALTHRLLAFSRRQTLAPKPTDLADLVGDMMDLIQRTVGPEITLHTNAAPGGPLVLIDPGQMENALLNLCINARDAMPRGGEILIDISSLVLEEDAAKAKSLSPGAYIVLRVADTGSGIPEDLLCRVFDPFFTTKPQGSGTGLGLSMVYGFVQQSGGQVDIASELGRGTSLFIYLPVHEGHALPSENAPPAEDSPTAGAGQTVLVVDDEPSVRILVAEVLNDLGYKALEASDGVSALAMLSSDLKINLLITDVGLPGGINGRQLVDAARAFRPTLKALFITGYAEQSVLNSSLENAIEILSKPFSLEELSRRIGDILSQPAAR